MLSVPGIFIVAIVFLAIWGIYMQTNKSLCLALCILAAFIYITSIPVFAFYLNDVIEHTYKRQLPPKDIKFVAIVLAGGIAKDENGRPLQPSVHTIERLYAAVKLSKEYPSCEFLIMSGCEAFKKTTVSVAGIMRDAAETMGCQAKIILEDKSRNTDENLKYSSEIVKGLGFKHVVIVTSNSHMERAMNFARKYIPEDIKIYAYPSGGYRPKTKLTYEAFLPNVYALSASCNGIKELIGNVVAKLSLK